MGVRVLHTIAETRQFLCGIRAQGKTIGLVPTMGALHAGHGRLIERAAAETDCVVVSIFVNPIQFNSQQDYDRYPRALAPDVRFCEARGVAAVFAPAVEEMYPRPPRTFVEVTGVSEELCGRFRPGHFRGVATVVAKLFHIVEPHRAYFGEKDAQQLAVIRAMVADLSMPVEVVGVPTVREPDGLALSSRNQLLDAPQRQVAPELYAALRAAQARIEAGERRPEEVRRAALALLARQPEIRVEYLEVVDPCEMRPVDHIAGPVRVAAAIWIGGVRLIDNLLAGSLS